MADRDAELESLTMAFWSVSRRLRHGSAQSLTPYRVSPSQSRALRTLLRHGPQRVGALAEHLGIAARSATEAVDGLEQRGLVSRAPDPSDRRATIVACTDEGRDLMQRIRASKMRGSDEIFARLSPVDRQTLARILGELDGSAEESTSG